MKVFSIKDVKVGSFNIPFTFDHEQQAVRQFQELVKDHASMISKYPADFELWELGVFDQSFGTFTKEHKCLISGAALVPEVTQSVTQEALNLEGKNGK